MSTIHGLLLELKNSVDSFIENQNGKINQRIETAVDIGIAIDNARTAWTYSNDLEKSENEIGKNIQDKLNALKGLVQILKEGEASAIAELSSRVKNFISSLELADWQPQLTGLSNRYVFVETTTVGEGVFIVFFDGNFKYAAKSHKGSLLDLDYSLSFPDFKSDDYQISQSIANDNTLAFKVKHIKGNLLSEMPSKGCKFIRTALKVRYDAGTLLSNIKEAEYNIWIGVHPLRPGKITLTCPREEVINVLEQSTRSATLSLKRKDFPNHPGLIEKTVTIYPTKGWNITTKAPPKLNDDPSSEIQVFNESQIDVNIRLPEGSAKTKFAIEYVERKEIREKREHSEEIVLTWGGWLPLHSSVYHVKFESFDGRTFEFSKPEEEIPYLKVRNYQGQPTIVAEIPEEQQKAAAKFLLI